MGEDWLRARFWFRNTLLLPSGNELGVIVFEGDTAKRALRIGGYDYKSEAAKLLAYFLVPGKRLIEDPLHKIRKAIIDTTDSICYLFGDSALNIVSYAAPLVKVARPQLNNSRARIVESPAMQWLYTLDGRIVRRAGSAGISRAGLRMLVQVGSNGRVSRRQLGVKP
jgi:hypothetical protein